MQLKVPALVAGGFPRDEERRTADLDARIGSRAVWYGHPAFDAPGLLLGRDGSGVEEREHYQDRHRPGPGARLTTPPPLPLNNVPPPFGRERSA